MEMKMHDQIFWTADRDAFSPFQRASSVIVSALIVGGLLFGLFATTAPIA
jgi:hypothetical protein